MKLDLSKLGSNELKELYLAVKDERERRSKKNPANHSPPSWTVPNKAVTTNRDANPPG